MTCRWHSWPLREPVQYESTLAYVWAQNLPACLPCWQEQLLGCSLQGAVPSCDRRQAAGGESKQQHESDDTLHLSSWQQAGCVLGGLDGEPWCSMCASSVLTNAADLSSGWYTTSQPGASRTQPVGNSQTLTCWEPVQCQVDHVVALSF